MIEERPFKTITSGLHAQKLKFLSPVLIIYLITVPAIDLIYMRYPVPVADSNLDGG